LKTTVRQSQRFAETRCVFCHDEFVDEEELSCQCGATYHSDCFQDYGCGTIGCAGKVQTKAQIRTQISRLAELAANLQDNYQRSIDSRIKRLRIVSWLWVLGALIIAFLAILCSIFQGPLLVKTLLCSGSLLSSAIGTIFHRTANKVNKENKVQEKDTT
jgi:hypothetical protein